MAMPLATVLPTSSIGAAEAENFTSSGWMMIL